jgi:DNA-binding transcriptional LysR family regulator
MKRAAIRSIETFCAVVEAGSFTRAAKWLGITPAAVSRAIATHEADLGVRLFRRTTRSMQLSEEGRGYFEPCRQALSLIEAAERGLSQKQTIPRGRIRMSVPTTYGHFRVLPVVARFTRAHPEVSFEVNVANRNIDFVAEGYDLAVRVGDLSDSTLVARKLEDAALGVYASPSYLEARGTPRSPSNLDAHALLGFVRPSTGRVMAWLFQDKDGAPFEIAPTIALRCSDDFLGCVTLAREGAGLVQAYRFIVERDVAQGALIEVLKPYAGRSRPFTLLEPSGRIPTLAVKLFAEALLAASRKPLKPRSTKPSRAKKPR